MTIMRRYNFLFAIVMALLLDACSDDFLDKKPLTTFPRMMSLVTLLCWSLMLIASIQLFRIHSLKAI